MTQSEDDDYILLTCVADTNPFGRDRFSVNLTSPVVFVAHVLLKNAELCTS